MINVVFYVLSREVGCPMGRGIKQEINKAS